MPCPGYGFGNFLPDTLPGVVGVCEDNNTGARLCRPDLREFFLAEMGPARGDHGAVDRGFYRTDIVFSFYNNRFFHDKWSGSANRRMAFSVV